MYVNGRLTFVGVGGQLFQKLIEQKRQEADGGQSAAPAPAVPSTSQRNPDVADVVTLDDDDDGDVAVLEVPVPTAPPPPTSSNHVGNGVAVEPVNVRRAEPAPASPSKRGQKRTHTAAFDVKEGPPEVEEDLFKGSQKRHFVLNRLASIAFFEQKLREFQVYNRYQNFDHPGEGEWSIGKKDQQFSRNPKGAKRRSLERPRCVNCNSRNHTTGGCPEPPKRSSCPICDSDLHRAHGLSTCPNKICHRCGLRDHGAHRCSSVNAKCRICDTWNHVESHCPDLWRRFHMTTSGTVPVECPEQPDIKKKCYWRVHSYKPPAEEVAERKLAIVRVPGLLVDGSDAPAAAAKPARADQPSTSANFAPPVDEDDVEEVCLAPPRKVVDVITVDDDDEGGGGESDSGGARGSGSAAGPSGRARRDDALMLNVSESDEEDLSSDVQRTLNDLGGDGGDDPDVVYELRGTSSKRTWTRDFDYPRDANWKSRAQQPRGGGPNRDSFDPRPSHQGEYWSDRVNQNYRNGPRGGFRNSGVGGGFKGISGGAQSNPHRGGNRGGSFGGYGRPRGGYGRGSHQNW